MVCRHTGCSFRRSQLDIWLSGILQVKAEGWCATHTQYAVPKLSNFRKKKLDSAARHHPYRRKKRLLRNPFKIQNYTEKLIMSYFQVRKCLGLFIRKILNIVYYFGLRWFPTLIELVPPAKLIFAQRCIYLVNFLGTTCILKNCRMRMILMTLM